MHRNNKVTSFTKFTWEYEVLDFSKLKLHVESPKLMVVKCVVTNCSTSYKTRQEKASFQFHKDQELKRKWIYFVNCKDWLPNAHLVVCVIF